MYLPHRDVEDNVEDFVHGLKDRIRIGVQTVLHRDPTRNTLEDAFAEAQRLDESIYNPSNGAVRTRTGPRPMELGQITSMDSDGYTMESELHAVANKPPPRRRNTRNYRLAAMEPNGALTANVECYYCHKRGHRQNDCRKKKRDEEYRRGTTERRQNRNHPSRRSGN